MKRKVQRKWLTTTFECGNLHFLVLPLAGFARAVKRLACFSRTVIQLTLIVTGATHHRKPDLKYQGKKLQRTSFHG